MKKDKIFQKEAGVGKTALLNSDTQSQAGFSVLGRMDWIIAPVIALIAGIVIYFNIYSAINWDDLMYMSLAQNTQPEAWIMNRYGHLYLMKLFFAMAGDAITGGRIYWCFIFCGTMLFTYWSAKILAGRKNTIIGIAAVLLAAMLPIFGREAGSPLSDFTVMFFVTGAAFIYLAFLNVKNKYSRLFLILLGAFLFWGMKSKETAVCIIVLFFGLGRKESGEFSGLQFVKDIGWVVCGMAAGSLLIMSLDQIFLGDFFFSVRPSNISKLLNSNLGEPAAVSAVKGGSMSWFSFFTTRSIFLPFVLYFLAGWHIAGKTFSTREKILWVLPIFLMLFLTFSRRAWYVVPRYFCPVVPVMCIWASQFLRFDFHEQVPVQIVGQTISKKAAAYVLGAIAFILVLGILMPNFTGLVKYYKLEDAAASLNDFPNVKYERMYPNQLVTTFILLPIVVSGLLAAAALSQKRGLVNLFLTSLCLFAIMIPSFADSRELVKTAVTKSRWRYEPCRVFKDEMKFDKDTKILVSKNLFASMWMLGRDRDSHCYMFNICLNQKLNLEQFIDGSIEDIVKGGYTYAFLTADDLAFIQKSTQFENLLKSYEVKQGLARHPSSNEMVPLVLIKKKPQSVSGPVQ